MRIGIAGPIATDNIASCLGESAQHLPTGYFGAPVLGTLIRALLERGHEVVAYTTSGDLHPSTQPVIARGGAFTIYYCPSRRHAFRPKDGHWGRACDAFALERSSLVQAMHRSAPDLVHAHWTYEFAMAAIESGLPNVITGHDAPQQVLAHSFDSYRLVRYFMARRVLTKAQYLTAVSPYLCLKLQSYAKAPIEVVPNPVSACVDSAHASGREALPGTPMIGMVLNSWSRLKNPKPAMRAFAMYKERIPTAQLLLIGKDYGVGQQAENWARSQGIQAGMRFVGPLPHDRLLTMLSGLDVLLHPSLEETFGMAPAEAMALGVPVIGGARSGAVPWLVSDTGALCDITDPTAIVGAIGSLLADRKVQAACGERASASIRRRFGPQHVTRAFEDIYKRVLQDRQGPLNDGLGALG
jgi:L-malate glycosyltransferase